MAEAPKKAEPRWQWYRLSIVDEAGQGFDESNADAERKIPFYAHSVAGHSFGYITERVTRNSDRQTVRIQQAGAIDRLWVTGNPEDCELLAVKAKMDKFVVRWKAGGRTADVFEKGSKLYRPERGDVPISKYLRMEEIPEPAQQTALV